MTQRDFQGLAMELALEAVGHGFPRLSLVGSGWTVASAGPRQVELDPPREAPVPVPASTNGYGIFLLDVTYTDDGTIYLIEANGSNAALTSSVLGKDDRRARHMYLAYMSKQKPRASAVTLLAYQPSLIHVGEFFVRAGIFAERVAELQRVRLSNTREILGEEDVSVVCGSIPDIADDIERQGSTLYYKGRPVCFATNPNLLPELVRRGLVDRKGDSYNIDVSIYHDVRVQGVS